jgi:hypothetical protein
MNTPHEPNAPSAEEFLLDSRLDDLKREVATLQAPDALEDALATRFRKHHRKSTRPNLWWVPPLALAATVALVSWMVRGPMPGPVVEAMAAQTEDAGPIPRAAALSSASPSNLDHGRGPPNFRAPCSLTGDCPYLPIGRASRCARKCCIRPMASARDPLDQTDMQNTKRKI